MCVGNLFGGGGGGGGVPDLPPPSSVFRLRCERQRKLGSRFHCARCLRENCEQSASAGRTDGRTSLSLELKSLGTAIPAVAPPSCSSSLFVPSLPLPMRRSPSAAVHCASVLCFADVPSFVHKEPFCAPSDRTNDRPTDLSTERPAEPTSTEDWLLLLLLLFGRSVGRTIGLTTTA